MWVSDLRASLRFSAAISIFMISGLNVRMVAVVFIAVFVSVVGVLRPSRREAGMLRLL